jgi:hypothetical protein
MAPERMGLFKWYGVLPVRNRFEMHICIKNIRNLRIEDGDNNSRSGFRVLFAARDIEEPGLWELGRGLPVGIVANIQINLLCLT